MLFCNINELKNPKSKEWILQHLEIPCDTDLKLINRDTTPIIKQDGVNIIDIDRLLFKTIKIGTKNYERLFSIIQYIIDNLSNSKVNTIRDLYYSNVDLYQHQRNVVSLVEDLACSLGISRLQLNLVASQKGTISGPLRFSLKTGTLDASSSPVSIPQQGTIEYLQTSATRLLIIEKDATFQSLVNFGYHCGNPSTILLTVLKYL